jgi:hypothetical protein
MYVLVFMCLCFELCVYAYVRVYVCVCADIHRCVCACMIVFLMVSVF